MSVSFLDLPEREQKPRKKGITSVIDNGVPLKEFESLLESHHQYIDFIKFGWGTSIVTPDMQSKIDCINAYPVDYFFGGTLFEKAYFQNKVDEYIEYCHHYGAKWIEVSDGTLEIPEDEKSGIISELAKEFKVMSEVGVKDVTRAEQLTDEYWVNGIRSSFDAGATYVITEGRESGRGGLFDRDGLVREGLLLAIEKAGFTPDNLIFEAPNKDQQIDFIKGFGPEVNLANIATSGVIGLETLRLGLRSDTFYIRNT